MGGGDRVWKVESFTSYEGRVGAQATGQASVKCRASGELDPQPCVRVRTQALLPLSWALRKLSFRKFKSFPRKVPLKMILALSHLLSPMSQVRVVWKKEEIPGKGVRGKESDRDTGKANERGALTELVTCGQLSLHPSAGFLRKYVDSVPRRLPH